MTLVAAACITEQRAILFVTLDPLPPDTVDDTELVIRGVIVRDPPDQSATFIVTAIATNPEFADTQEVVSGSAGVFSVTVSIARDTIGILNTVVLTASDNSEESLSDEASFTVLGLITGPALRRDDE